MFLAGALNELIRDYFMRHLSLYLVLIILFTAGLGCGAVATQKLSAVQRGDLTNYLADIYISIAQNNRLNEDKGEVFYRSIIDNVLKTTALFFILGLTVIGAPLILVVVFVRGFVLGFTVGFFVQETMVQGLILSTTAVLPHNLLIVPAVLLSAASALSFSATALKTLLGISREGIYGQFASTTFLSLCSSILLVMAALIETYLTPIFMQLSRSLLV